MRILTPSDNKRINELIGFVGLSLAVLLTLSLLSYSPHDASFNVSAPAPGAGPARNWIGPVGAHMADLLFQFCGFAAFLFSSPAQGPGATAKIVQGCSLSYPRTSPRYRYATPNVTGVAEVSANTPASRISARKRSPAGNALAVGAESSAADRRTGNSASCAARSAETMW